MYIKRIELTNIRCFEHLEIDLSSNGNVRKWAVILGNNGVGKTTLLRSIAVGLCDETSAAGLIKDLQGEWVRKGSPNHEGTIEIELIDSDQGRSTSSKITIFNDNGREIIRDFDSPIAGSPQEDIFVCAYGAGRGVFGAASYEKYRTIDSVYTLFSYDTVLQNPELTLRRIESTGVKIPSILHSIDNILMLPVGSTNLGPSGISISGPWGEFMPLDSIGDGYRATLAWVIDLLGWAMFYQGPILERDKLAGIVLIDELEQHLHPIWQRHIIRLLREQFPNIQFVGTSHSPLCASGLADLSDENCRLVVFERADEKGPVKGDISPSLRGLRADQVLTSRAFGLPETRNPEIEKKLTRLRELLLKESLNEQQRAELSNLHDFVEQQVPGLAEREEDRHLEQRLAQWLIENATDFERPKK